MATYLGETFVDIAVRQAAWDNGHTEYRVATAQPSVAYLAWMEEMLGEKVDG